MPNRYTRQLIFKSNNLEKQATLVLIFDKPSDDLYTKKLPVIWQTPLFQAHGQVMTSLTYHNKPAFLKPGVESDVIRDISASQILYPSQQTKLEKEKGGRFSFTDPETGPANLVTVVNGTDDVEDISLGFAQVNPDRPVTPVYYWNAGDFPSEENIETKLNPILRAYVTDQYQDNQIIRSEIPVPCIFEEDLSKLDDTTVWLLSYDAATGQFKISLELE